jgi:hypothetical protein
MDEDESSKDNPLTAYLAWIVGIGGILIAIILRVCAIIPDWSVIFLIALFVLAAIAVGAFSRLEEINLRQLSIRLRKVEEAEKRIYAREKIVRELMLELADLAAMETLNFSRLSGSEYAQLMRQWRDKRVDEILDLVEATPEEKNHLRRYVPIYQGIDDANALPVPPPQRDEAAAPFWQQLRDQFQSEI